MSANKADPAIVSELKHWLRDDVLPFWAAKGRDARTGLFLERFLADRKPDLAAPLRVRVQFRQIYCLSHAAVLGWFPQGAEIALAAWEATRKHFWNGKDGGGFFHILASDGSVSDARHDSYDHAFSVLALSWLARATGERRLHDELDELLAYIDARLTDADGILLEGDPHSLPRRQNPQMHWFEAMLAMHDAVAHPQALERAARYRRFFEAVLFDRASGTLGEYFTQDFKPAPGEAGGSVEPGHQAEWTWLLRSHERFAGLPTSREAATLLDTALATADPELGLLVDEADRSNRVRRGTRRSWLQTELAKAWIAEAEVGRPEAREHALLALGNLDRFFLRKPFAEGWIDQLDEAGRPIRGPVPASTLYHIQVAIVEADRVLSA
jgi:mannose/cellobiose epimerase-like protein (N-acyl-D-glucosamine 2-epimerase family)